MHYPTPDEAEAVLNQIADAVLRHLSGCGFYFVLTLLTGEHEVCTVDAGTVGTHDTTDQQSILLLADVGSSPATLLIKQHAQQYEPSLMSPADADRLMNRLQLLRDLTRKIIEHKVTKCETRYCEYAGPEPDDDDDDDDPPFSR